MRELSVVGYDGNVVNVAGLFGPQQAMHQCRPHTRGANDALNT